MQSAVELKAAALLAQRQDNMGSAMSLVWQSSGTPCGVQGAICAVQAGSWIDSYPDKQRAQAPPVRIAALKQLKSHDLSCVLHGSLILRYFVTAKPGQGCSADKQLQDPGSWGFQQLLTET